MLNTVHARPTCMGAYRRRNSRLCRVRALAGWRSVESAAISRHILAPHPCRHRHQHLVASLASQSSVNSKRTPAQTSVFSTAPPRARMRAPTH